MRVTAEKLGEIQMKSVCVCDVSLLELLHVLAIFPVQLECPRMEEEEEEEEEENDNTQSANIVHALLTGKPLSPTT